MHAIVHAIRCILNKFHQDFHRGTEKKPRKRDCISVPIGGTLRLKEKLRGQIKEMTTGLNVET